MKRSSTGTQGGREGGNNTKKSKYSSSTSTATATPALTPPPPPVMGTVATRTRHQQKKKASSWNKPIPILIHILTYADPETLWVLCLISTQFYDIISNAPAMENHRVVPLLQISPSKNTEKSGRLIRTVEQLHHHRDKLQHYHKIKLVDCHEFGWSRWHCRLVQSFQLHGIIKSVTSYPT